MAGIGKFENKLKNLEKIVNMRYSDDYIIVFLSSENDKTINIRYTTENRQGVDIEIKTEKDFLEFFKDRKVMLLFTDDIDSDPEPDSLADAVFNKGLTDKIHVNRDIRIEHK